MTQHLATSMRQMRMAGPPLRTLEEFRHFAPIVAKALIVDLKSKGFTKFAPMPRVDPGAGIPDDQQQFIGDVRVICQFVLNVEEFNDCGYLMRADVMADRLDDELGCA